MTGHRLFTLAALTLLAVACNREAISPDEGHERLIDFSAYFAQDATKAQGEITGTVFAANDSIGVFACYTGDMVYDLTSVSPDFMYNQKVTYEGGSNWTYSPVKYWPNNESEKISFFSYYPYISSEKALTSEDGIIGFSKSNAKGDPWLVYKLPKEAPYSQKDLMYGTPQLNQEKPTQSDQKINFVLKHALACIADSVTVQMSPELYTKMHDSLDISITGLRIVYSNLTNKARLVLNSTDEPIWKEVISGELQTSRTYSKQDITDQKFSKDVAESTTVLTIDKGHGLFYIPMQIEGQPKPEVRITLSYKVDGLEDHGSFTDSVVTVKQFTIGDIGAAGKKQRLALKLTEDFNLDADIITEAEGISMADDLLADYEDVKIDYEVDTVRRSYSGEVQTYTIPRTGTYKLEAWGAKGGDGKGGGSEGALGGYITAQFKFSIGDVLYIYVGGKGGDASVGSAGTGGWNGGGNGGAPYNVGNYGGAGGGGATHIAMSNIGPIGESSITTLGDYVGTVGHLLLVAAGGGGGSCIQNAAGYGGGETGQRGRNNGGSYPDLWYNGVYSYGATGGKGGNGYSYGAEGNGGGGGGYLGGNTRTLPIDDDNQSTGGSGGSSHANTARYNYAGESSTTANQSPTPDQNGYGLVVITFVNELL